MRDIITLMLNMRCHGNTYGNVHSTILINFYLFIHSVVHSVRSQLSLPELRVGQCDAHAQ